MHVARSLSLYFHHTKTFLRSSKSFRWLNRVGNICGFEEFFFLEILRVFVVFILMLLFSSEGKV